MLLALLPWLALPAAGADVDRYRSSASAVAGEGTLQGESPVLGPEGGSGGLLANFAQDPVVSERAGDAVTPAVSAMLPVDVYGGWTASDKVRVDLFLPVYAHVQAPVTGHGGAALGDLRLQAAIPFHSGRTFSAGILPRVELPTGSANALTRGGFTGGGALLLAGNNLDGTAGWLANLGATGAATEQLDGVALGSTVDAVVGAFWRPNGAFRAGAEVDLRAGLPQGPAGGTTTADLHLFAQQVLPSGWGLLVGAGTGLIEGVGSPDYRVIAGLHFGARLADADGDGLIGDDDGCPDRAEDLDGFEDTDGCPDPDNDADGVVDSLDQCAGTPEDLDGFDDRDGCPDPDNDDDGFVDAEDACPGEEGDFEGCPDSDRDGLADHLDACPTEPRPDAERLELSDGCPKGVYLTDFTIAHDLPIAFVGPTADLDTTTLHVLDAVLGMLLSHPEMTRVEVQTRVDGRTAGSADRLSAVRAQAVVDYLTERSVEPERLIPKGLGQAQPDQDDSRVVFRVVAVDRSLMAPPPQPPSKPAAMGTLAVSVPGVDGATVEVDGSRIERKAPFVDLPVPAGPHDVRVYSLRDGLDETRTIDVVAGEQARVVIDASGSSTVTAPRSVIDVQVTDPDEARKPKRDKKKTKEKRPPRSSKKR